MIQEPSDDQLISFIEDIPLQHGYSQLETSYVLPWSVNEVWANIYNFEAPYSFDKALEEMGEVFLSDEKWSDNLLDDELHGERFLK